MLFGGGRGEFLELGDITRPESWHTQDTETDPWDWKDRLAESREGAYVRVLDGRATLIDSTWIPTFIAAFRERATPSERYEAGELDSMTARMAVLFDEHPEWARHELTSALSVGDKQKGAFVRALTNLQREMAVVVCGQTQRVAWNGQPIGWPSMRYASLASWADPTWLEAAVRQSSSAALTAIRERIMHISPQCPPKTLARLCGMGASES